MELVMRTFASILLGQYFGFVGICWASPLAWVGAMIPLTVSIVLTMKRLMRKFIAEQKQLNQANFQGPA
jgi:hypothetical protein